MAIHFHTGDEDLLKALRDFYMDDMYYRAKHNFVLDL